MFLGTGKYEISDRTIYVFRLPFEFNLKPTDYESGNKIGLRLLAPIAIGVTNFEDISEVPDFNIDDIQTITVTPGIEVPIEVKQDWHIKPFIQAGVGLDAKSDAKSFVWGAGVRSSYLPSKESNWIFGGEFLSAGNRPDGDNPNTSFSRIGIGAEYKIPTSWKIFDRNISWHARIIHWHFTDAVNFKPPSKPTDIHNATEIGFSLGLNPGINILGYNFTQGGIGYEKADGYDAIVLFTTFPF
ncbi:MAG: hypothetical protein V7744_20340 [Pseudomonadales bacterium]